MNVSARTAKSSRKNPRRDRDHEDCPHNSHRKSKKQLPCSLHDHPAYTVLVLVFCVRLHPLFFSLYYTLFANKTMTPQVQPYNIVVIVLGDLGRSPRMQYQTLSLLQQGHKVHFVGYTGEALIDAMQKFEHNGQLSVVRFPSMKILDTSSFRLFTWPLYLLWRIVSLTALLAHALWFRVATPVDGVLVQNPPAVPLLMVAVTYCRMQRAALIIDWHNLGYSMLPPNGLVRYLARQYETFWTPYADGHLTVTKALKEYLISDWHILGNQTTPTNISVLYDCPPALFRLRSIKEQHCILKKLHDKLAAHCPKHWTETLNSDTQTLFTEEYAPGRYRPRKDRPAFIISATSWTRDENFGMLLQSLQELDERISSEQSNSSLLKVFCLLTGKGALKESYEEHISRLPLQHVVVCTCWLEPTDYPVLLACADLGVSLHTSTSGMDLPIKILDYFGCEVPVCAYKFPGLSELVRDDVNGRTFTSSEEMSQILWELLEPLSKSKVPVGNHDFGPLKQFSLQVQGKMLW